MCVDMKMYHKVSKNVYIICFIRAKAGAALGVLHVIMALLMEIINLR